MSEIIKYSDYLRIVKRTNQQDYVLYHSLFGNLCLVDDNLYQLLSFFKDGESMDRLQKKIPAALRTQLNGFIQTLINKSFLVPSDTDEYSRVQEALAQLTRYRETGKQIKVIQLVVSNLCNFRCNYCFVDSIYTSQERLLNQADKNNQVMKKDHAISYLMKIIEMQRTCGNTAIGIQFFGGEPLTNWETVRHVLDYFKDGSGFGIHMYYSIVTNGSLITEEVADYFYNYDVATIISFDSPKSNNRLLRNGTQSKAIVEKALDLLCRKKCTIIFNTSIVKENFDIIDTDLIDYGLTYNIKEIGLLFDLNLDFYQEISTHDILKKFSTLYFYAQQKGVVLAGYWKTAFDNLLDASAYLEKGYKTCSATGTQLSIEPNGCIFACKGTSAFFGHIDNLQRVFNSENYINYLNRTFRNSDACIGCAIENSCSGLCPGSLEKYYSNIHQTCNYVCDLNKAIISFLINQINRDEIESYSLH